MSGGKGLQFGKPNAAEYSLYLQTGRQAYTDHYCHLWPEGDPSPYLSRNFTEALLKRDMANSELLHWLIRWEGHPAGICKIDLGRERPGFHKGRALFLEKIYLCSEYTGRGFGAMVMRAVEELARASGRNAIWLETMKKGPAKDFYAKLGYRIIGETSIPYPEVLRDEMAMWVMGLDLN